MCMILLHITHNNIFYLPNIYMKIHKARRPRPEQKQRHIHTAAILHFCVHKEILMYIIYNFFVLIQYYHYYYCFRWPLEFLITNIIPLKMMRPNSNIIIDQNEFTNIVDDIQSEETRKYFWFTPLTCAILHST